MSAGISNLTEKSLLRIVLCLIEVVSIVDVGRPITQGQESVRTLQLQLEEQQTKRNGSEQLIGHLREELERLQSENAEEWGRRERLDAEKQVWIRPAVDYFLRMRMCIQHSIIQTIFSLFKNCERENRKLRHQLDEVRDRARKLSEQQSQLAQGEVGRMRAQTDAASRELLELRHSHGRLRKVMAMSIRLLLLVITQDLFTVHCRRMRIAGRK